jgi:hypothetical protein
MSAANKPDGITAGGASAPAFDVPDIVIMPPEEEAGGGSGAPAVRIADTVASRTPRDLLGELAERHPSVAVPSPQRAPLRFIDVVAADDLWKYIIEARHHGTALAEHPADPGGYYDADRSPGYRAAMLRTFNEVFTREGPMHLDWDTYDELHRQLTSGLEGNFRRSGVGAGMASFPLSAARPAPDILEEVIGGRPLMSLYDGAGTRTDAYRNAGSLTVCQRHLLGRVFVFTLYESAETPALVNEVFDRFRTEISSAATDLDRLIVISRTIRALHVLHPYTDGNGRLNLYVLLPYLLLQYGFHPVTGELHAVFNGGYSLPQIAAVLLDGQP